MKSVSYGVNVKINKPLEEVGDFGNMSYYHGFMKSAIKLSKDENENTIRSFKFITNEMKERLITRDEKNKVIMYCVDFIDSGPSNTSYISSIH